MSQKQGASRIESQRNRRSKANHSGPGVKKDVSSRKGASVQKTVLKDRWQSYLAHHRSSAQDSWQRLMVAPWQSFMTALVMAIALALPATLWVSLNNVQSIGEQWDSAPKLTVFIDTKAREAAIKALQDQLSARRLVEAVEYVSARQALQDFETTSGMGSALRSLESNPLPPTLVISPAAMTPIAELELLAEDVKQSPLVDDVLYDQAWIKRLHFILNIGQRLVLGLAGLLIIGALLVIGNTIRLAIENRRDEIVIIKLVGGTDAFVRRPFLYTGLWYGLAGGFIACLLLLVGVAGLSAPVADLAGLYQSEFRIQGLGFGRSVLLLLLASAVGWLGAWLTVARQLQNINPE